MLSSKPKVLLRLDCDNDVREERLTCGSSARRTRWADNNEPLTAAPPRPSEVSPLLLLLPAQAIMAERPVVNKDFVATRHRGVWVAMPAPP